MERLRPPKEKALLLEQFVEAGQVEPVMLSGRTLYLFPDGLAAQRPYLLLAEAMKVRVCWAVGRITMTGRRYAVVVRPQGRLLAMHVLHDPALVRSAATLAAAAVEEEPVQVLQLLDALKQSVAQAAASKASPGVRSGSRKWRTA